MLRSGRRRGLAIAPVLLIALAAGSFATTPAAAAVDPDCARTFVGGVDSATAINIAFSTLREEPTPPTYCFSGDFTIDVPLDVRGSVTLRGLGGATFSVTAASAITTLATVDDVTITVEGLTIVADADRPMGDSLIDGRVLDAPVSTNVILRDSVLSGGDAQFGGAVFGSLVIAERSEFIGNSAARGGAIFALSVATISSSTFESNAAAEFGGAIWGSAVVDIDNSTFADNSALDEGGAIYAFGGRVQLSTFLDNTAPAPVDGGELPGDAIYLDAFGGTDLVIRGNIFAGSTENPQLGIGNAVARVFIDRGGNLFSTAQLVERDLPAPAASSRFGLSSAEIFGAEPRLDDNGGPTRTIGLTAASAAVDVAGDATLGGPSVDQRGLPRGELRDAGAVELQPGEGEAPPGGGGEEPPGGGEEPPADGGGGESPQAPALQPELAESGAADLRALALVAVLLALLGGSALLRARRV